MTTKCYDCGQEELPLDNTESTTFHTVGNFTYCNDCFNDKFTKCEECGNVILQVDSIEAKGVHCTYILCESCSDHICVTCMCCENIFYKYCCFQDRNNNWLCSGCKFDYTVCNSCGTFAHSDESRFVECAGRSYCNDCLHEYFTLCVSCEEYHWNEDINENGYCRNCEDDDENPHVHSYDYIPYPLHFLDIDGNKRKSHILYFGIELEVESRNCGEDIPQEVEKLPDFVYAKEDGSLSYGFEIVSHPATWEWLQKNKELWNKILTIRRRGFRSYNTNTCGLHVHMSNDAFSGLHLFKFLKLFFEHPDFVFLISQRGKSNLEHWASLTSDESLVYKARTKHGRTKYVAVNTCNSYTIEIRIFKGTLSESGFWKNIEFCKAAFDFTKQAGIADITADKFMEYVGQNKKMFPNLYKFIQRKFFDKDTENEED